VIFFFGNNGNDPEETKNLGLEKGRARKVYVCMKDKLNNQKSMTFFYQADKLKHLERCQQQGLRERLL